jgi:hypothetical protein
MPNSSPSPSPLDLEHLTCRVARLERQNRLLRWTGAAAILLAPGLVMMGQSAPQRRVIEAERFVLKGSGGNTRGVFEVNSEGATSLTLNDPKDAAAISIVVERNGGGYITCNRPTGGRMLLQATDDSMGLRFWARGQRDRPLAALLCDPQGRTSLALGGGRENEAPLFLTSGGDGATAGMNLRAPNSQAMIRLAITRDGAPLLTMTDSKGEVIHNIPAKEDETEH